jgi:hypothetical protein
MSEIAFILAAVSLALSVLNSIRIANLIEFSTQARRNGEKQIEINKNLIQLVKNNPPCST